MWRGPVAEGGIERSIETDLATFRQRRLIGIGGGPRRTQLVKEIGTSVEPRTNTRFQGIRRRRETGGRPTLFSTVPFQYFQLPGSSRIISAAKRFWNAQS